MATGESNACRNCKGERPADAPWGLCPTCLLKSGLAEGSLESHAVTLTLGPAATGVLAALGEELGSIPSVLLRDVHSPDDAGPIVRPTSSEIPDPTIRSARLQLLGEIARGGMGAVLKGRDTDLGRDLAVKILLDSHRLKPDMTRRFIEEAQIAGQLQHPGIVPVYELGAFGDGRPYFAMKLVKGHTLAALLAARKGPSDDLPRFLAVFESICQTMAYAHARGVIHRDLKPSNVMVGSFGEVQVMDWGLAKVLSQGGAAEDAPAGLTTDDPTVIATARSHSDSDASQAGSVLGTPAYMAPEQARGEIDLVDERADVFALGSIFCEILTGQPAFTGRNAAEIQRKAARGDLVDAATRLEAQRPPLNSELVVLAKSCLASEREDRLRNAGEVADAVSLYHARVQERLRQSEIEREAAKARAEEAARRASVERHRFRLTVALAAALVGLASVGGSAWTLFAQQRAKRREVTERLVNDAVNRANLLRGRANAAPPDDTSGWPDAIAAGNEARSALSAGESTEAVRTIVDELMSTLDREYSAATRRAEEIDKDRRFLRQLDSIRSRSVDQRNLDRIDVAYAAAFRDFGIDLDRLEAVESSQFLKRRSDPQALASRLDDWMLIRKAAARKGDQAPWHRLLAAATATDANSWRNSLRSMIAKADHKAALRLSSDRKVLLDQSARSLYLLAQAIEGTRDGDYHAYYLKDSIEVLKLAWSLSPNDYQICRALGMHSIEEVDRIRFCTTSVTAEPDNPFARKGLAEALLPQGAIEENVGRMTSTVSIGKGGRSDLENDPDRWSYPRLTIESPDGRALLLGPGPPLDMRAVNPSRVADAVEELQRAVRMEPSSIRFRMSLACALVVQGRFEEAMGTSEAIRRLDPKYSQGNEIGRVLYLRGELDRAIQVVRQDIVADPGGDHYYALMGYAYHEQNKLAEAFEAYRNAYLRSESEQDLYAIGLEATGDSRSLVNVYREAIQKRPNSVEPFLRLAQVEMKSLGAAERRKKLDEYLKWIEARARLSEFAGKKARLSLFCNNIAWKLATDSRAESRDGACAVRYATRACELSGFKDAEKLDTLAAAFAESGDFKSAVKWQSKAVELQADAKEKGEYGKRMALYRSGRAFHE